MNISTLLYEVVSTVAYGGNALINVRREQLAAAFLTF